MFFPKYTEITLKIVIQERVFLKNTSKLKFYWLRLFIALSPLVKHLLALFKSLFYRLAEGSGQNQALGAFYLR